MKLHVGQKLYKQVAYRNEKPTIKVCEITKIGLKYLYVDNDNRYPIEKDTLIHRSKMYSQNNFQMYLTEQEILDKWETNTLISECKKHFGNYGNLKFTLEQLRAINKIINP